MAFQFNGTNQYLSIGSAIKSATPVSMSYRIYPETNSNANVIVEIGNLSRTDYFLAFLVASTTTLRTLQQPGSSTFADNTGANDNQWHHGASVFAANNDRTGYLNNASSSTSNTATTPAATNTAIGGTVTGVALWQGRIADVAIWNVALTADDVNSLYKGFKASRVRPQSLLFYSPLIRNLQDLKAAVSITNNNTATVGDHPRVY